MKKIPAILLTLLLLTSVACPALAESEFHAYQNEVLGHSNEYHNGPQLALDARLCALAAVLAMEQDNKTEMGAYRPGGEKWDSVFDQFGYETAPASSGCNWMLFKAEPSASEIVDYWMKTPGFKENVRSSMFTHTGIYIHRSPKTKRYYVVQLFTKPAIGQSTALPSEALGVTVGSVNVRSGPGTAYERIGKLSKGQILSVLSSSAKWAECALPNNETGYIHTKYLGLATAPASAPTDVPSTPADVPSTDPGTLGPATATGSVNVRSGPGKSYKRLGKLRKEQTVAVWAIHGKWAEITWTGSQKGYVHTDYLSIPAANAAAAPHSAP